MTPPKKAPTPKRSSAAAQAVALPATLLPELRQLIDASRQAAAVATVATIDGRLWARI